MFTMRSHDWRGTDAFDPELGYAPYAGHRCARCGAEVALDGDRLDQQRRVWRSRCPGTPSGPPAGGADGPAGL